MSVPAGHMPIPGCRYYRGDPKIRFGDVYQTVCPGCCKHDQGFWPLTNSHYGWKQGYRWCCLAGCGFVLKFNPEELGD